MHKLVRPFLLSLIIVTLIAVPSAFARSHHHYDDPSQGESEVVAPPASVEVAFSPHQGATELVVKSIRSAKHSVLVAAYSFTSRPIADALIAAHRSGIVITVVIDHEQVSGGNHSVAPELAAENIPIRVDYIHKIQHDKYLVIDNATVETGSFNFTAAAEKSNAENVIVLWNDATLAALYAKNWKNLWDAATPYTSQ